MRRTKSGAIHKHSLNAQDFPHVPRDPHEALLTETKAYLGQLNRFAPRWQHGEDVRVKTVRVAAQNLLEFLERNTDAHQP